MFGAAGHALPQPPQCTTLVFRLTSQPFPALWSQSSKDSLQVNPHSPATHVALAFFGELQVFLHVPQWLRLLFRSASQPFALLLSQFP
jgi:hypothetical protein